MLAWQLLNDRNRVVFGPEELSLSVGLRPIGECELKVVDGSAELTEVLAKKMEIALVHTDIGYIARIDLPIQQLPLNTALSFRLMFFDNGMLIGKSAFWLDTSVRGRREGGSTIECARTNMLSMDRIVSESVDVVVVSDAALALRDFEARSCWEGGFQCEAIVEDKRMNRK